MSLRLITDFVQLQRAKALAQVIERTILGGFSRTYSQFLALLPERLFLDRVVPRTFPEFLQVRHDRLTAAQGLRDLGEDVQERMPGHSAELQGRRAAGDGAPRGAVTGERSTSQKSGIH